MNRPIEFRAWDKQHKSMSNSFELLDAIFMDNDKSMHKVWHRQIFMQFTGLKDKNGVKIFEGDIIKILYWKDEESEDSSTHKVVWGDDYPAFDLEPYLECDSNGLQYAQIEYELEVIGNVYQNPELLK